MVFVLQVCFVCSSSSINMQHNREVSRLKVFVGFIATFLTTQSLFATEHTKPCQDKINFLHSICDQKTNHSGQWSFSQCANQYSYNVKSGDIEEPTFNTPSVICMIEEKRFQGTIESRTSYFDTSNKKVVVYQHDNGLANAYIYGNTGYYHVTKFATGESVLAFHSFD